MPAVTLHGNPARLSEQAWKAIPHGSVVIHSNIGTAWPENVEFRNEKERAEFSDKYLGEAESRVAAVNNLRRKAIKTTSRYKVNTAAFRIFEFFRSNFPKLQSTGRTADSRFVSDVWADIKALVDQETAPLAELMDALYDAGLPPNASIEEACRFIRSASSK